MAIYNDRAVVASSLLVISLLLLHMVEADHHQMTMDTEGYPLTPPSIDCGVACAARCKLSSRPRLCKRACGTCCYRCKCVPPGTSGNLEACPCYANMTTHGNRRKCP
ncbi:PREDICTED: gibberellin-regulated protein 1-like [Nelumbo nucifera]|uniref:Gibberellin-regulated protein 1-like n=2 Tax=Nelumbo nucifera TaxID=4432 RepID=A0A1U8AQX1_NELNU|nr:PREDICTED: gibberellin-regulated protein 1-like [Nelumbo nucifera]DAD22379.1 TPA_asm: hypothetical protein HUJ06_023842 [Nelumbo nucifera]